MRSIVGEQYYERKSGSTFYTYVATSEGYLRNTTTFNLESKYTNGIKDEIYVHMFDYSDYEFDDYDVTYRYIGECYSSHVQFYNGYLIYSLYVLGYNLFRIGMVFETTIDIPKSYYYE